MRFSWMALEWLLTYQIQNIIISIIAGLALGFVIGLIYIPPANKISRVIMVVLIFLVPFIGYKRCLIETCTLALHFDIFLFVASVYMYFRIFSRTEIISEY